MGNKIEVTVEERTVRGKKVASLRKQSIVPAVVYGPGMKPVNIQVSHNHIEKIYHQAGGHTPVHLKIGSKKRIAMIKDVEFDVVKHTIKHVSFHAVKANEPVVAEVPIELVDVGESEAERSGLVVLQALEGVDIKALPMDLPESLEVSVKSLKKAGDKLTVADVPIPEGVELVDHAVNETNDTDRHYVTELVVASAYEPSALQSANEEAGGDAEEADADAVESEKGGENASSDENKAGA